MKNITILSKKELVRELWRADPEINALLKRSETLHDARNRLFEYLNGLERHYFNVYSDKQFKTMHILERNNAKECIRALKNIIRTENEALTDFSALKLLFSLAKRKAGAEASNGFLCEFISLFNGINGNSGLAHASQKQVEKERNPALARSAQLDEYSKKIRRFFKRYGTGFDAAIIRKRTRLKEKILDFFGADEKDWGNYSWHLKHIIRDSRTLSRLVVLEPGEREGLRLAEENDIPVQITPYYLSLFNETGRTEQDRAIRAQVIPSRNYCLRVMENRQKGTDMDFMDEKSTSPVDSITRRYPMIVILKPFESCPQICVYCQRNWEIKRIENAKVIGATVAKAISWIRNNENIREVLVTGGDPLTLDNQYLDSLLNQLAKIKHIERIRIGTRVLVTLPFRINEEFVRILSKYHELGKREVCIVTHFEHSTEITLDSLEAIKKIKSRGIDIYNQQVFTYFNSRKYETCVLRKTLKLCGVEPYYLFNTKGKEETLDFRVPIARIEQEVKEEARLLPGIVRTDEAVFNVPKLGKSYLRAWQDHEPIMILADGCRAYRFYPWESKLSVVDGYLYTDVSIYDYLKRLDVDGENLDDYQSIWYYF